MNSLQESIDLNLASSHANSDSNQISTESDSHDHNSLSSLVMIRSATSQTMNPTEDSKKSEEINHSENSSCGCSSSQDSVAGITNNNFIVRAQSNDSLIGTRSLDGLSYLLDSTQNQFTLTPGFSGSYFGGVLGLGGSDYLIGSSGVDIINGNQSNDTIIGGDGDDLLRGGQDEDLIFGNKGNDIIFGDKGKDTVYAGQDNDYVNGNQGDDVIFGDKGNDILRGGRDNDLINGGDKSVSKFNT